MSEKQSNFRHATPPRAARAGGFTLIEILIVVVILGILAAIVMPQFSSASYQARENTLKDELRYLRTQITVFKAQHRDASPGYPAGSPGAGATQDLFIDQMTKYSDEWSNVSAIPTVQHRYGPYLSQMPANPLNSLSGVMIASTPAEMVPTGTDFGWIYNPQTQEIVANLTGADHDNVPYAKY